MPASSLQWRFCQGAEMTDDRLSLLSEISDVLETVVNKRVELAPGMNIVNDLGLDSIAVMNFCMALEDKFDISIPLNDMASVVTVDDLAATIETLRSNA
jgi:acyl carrier protein